MKTKTLLWILGGLLVLSWLRKKQQASQAVDLAKRAGEMVSEGVERFGVVVGNLMPQEGAVEASSSYSSQMSPAAPASQEASAALEQLVIMGEFPEPPDASTVSSLTPDPVPVPTSWPLSPVPPPPPPAPPLPLPQYPTSYVSPSIPLPPPPPPPEIPPEQVTEVTQVGGGVQGVEELSSPLSGSSINLGQPIYKKV